MNVLTVDGNGSQSRDRRWVCEEDVIGDSCSGRRQKTSTHCLDSGIWTNEWISKDSIIATRVVPKEGIHRIIESNTQMLRPFRISVGKAVDRLSSFFHLRFIGTLELSMMTAVEFVFVDVTLAPSCRLTHVRPRLVKMETHTHSMMYS
jgi:hypothetical protein